MSSGPSVPVLNSDGSSRTASPMTLIIVGRLQVRGDRMLTAIVIENEKGESLILSYDQPIPVPVPGLEGGRVKTHRDDAGLPSRRIQIALYAGNHPPQRRDPRSVAARFADCRVYRSVTDSILNIKIAKIPHPGNPATVVQPQRRGDRQGSLYPRPRQVPYLVTGRIHRHYNPGGFWNPRGLKPASRRDSRRYEPRRTAADCRTHGNWKWISAFTICIIAAAIALRRFSIIQPGRQQTGHN